MVTYGLFAGRVTQADNNTNHEWNGSTDTYMQHSYNVDNNFPSHLQSHICCRIFSFIFIFDGTLSWSLLLNVNLGQTQLICCFSDLSHTHLKGSRGIKIKIKGKRGKHLHENTIIWGEKFYLKKKKISFPFHERTGGSEKQQINWVWP